MEILFIATSNFNDPSSQDWHSDIRYTVSFLRSHGIDAGFISRPLLSNHDHLVKSISNMGPDNVFFHVTEENIDTVTSFIPILKQACPEVRIIVGGVPAAVSSRKKIMSHKEIDWLVVGERDLTLLECLLRLRNGQNCNDVEGLCSSEFTNPPRPLIPDLDALGDMVYDGLDEHLGSLTNEEKVGNLRSSRGCYAQCSFCSIPSFYGASKSSWRGRSVKAVVDEMEKLSATFGISYFVFEDDNFFGPGRSGQERAIIMAQEIQRRDLHLRFFFCCRLNDIHKDSFTALKEAGLDGVGVGVETTNDESLRLFNKGLRAEQIYPALDLLDELKIRVEINMIFFDPYITLEGVRTNLALLEYLGNKEKFFYSSSFPYNELKPFAWSPISMRLKAEGLLNESDNSCYYRDPKVSMLVDWVRHLRTIIPPVFKRRFIDSRSSDDMDDPLLRYQRRLLTIGTRHWIGVCLLPRYIKRACDLLEEETNYPSRKFDALERELIDDLKPLINSY